MWHFSPLVYKSGFGICFCTTYVASSLAFDKHSSGDAKHSTPQLKRFSSHTGEQNPKHVPLPNLLALLFSNLWNIFPLPKCQKSSPPTFFGPERTIHKKSNRYIYTPRKGLTFSHLNKNHPWNLGDSYVPTISIFRLHHNMGSPAFLENIKRTEWLVPQFLSVSFRNHGHGASSVEASGASPTHCLTDFFGGKNELKWGSKSQGNHLKMKSYFGDDFNCSLKDLLDLDLDMPL